MGTRQLTLTIVGDASQLSRTFAKVVGDSEGLGRKLTSTGQTLTRHLTLPIVGAGVAAGKLAFDFQDAMTKVQGLVGASAKQTEAWGRQILELAPKVGKSPKELADALYFITSSGISAGKTMDALTVSAKLSAIGLGETSVVADAVTSAVNAYAAENLSAAKAGDIFTATVKEGKAEAASLAPVLGNVLPVAQQMGVGFDQVGASIAEMTLKGTDAETAVTNLSAIFSSLLKPAAQSRQEMKTLGMSADDIRKSVRERGLLKTLEDLSARVGDNKDALGKLFPNVRALRGYLQLTGGDVKSTEELFDRLRHTTGQLGTSFDRTSKGEAFRFRQEMARLQVEGVKAGNVLLPLANDLGSAVGSMLDKFDGLPDGQKKLVAFGIAGAAALGPLLTVVGNVARGLGSITRLVGTAGRALGAGSKAAGAATSALGVQKVYVVNMPPALGAGRGGGVPGASIARVGAAAGRSELPADLAGIGLGAGATPLAPVAAGTAATVGGLFGLGALAKADRTSWHIFTADPEDIRREVRKAQDSLVAAVRAGAPATGRDVRKALGVVFADDDTIRQWQAQAKKGADAFADALAKGGPKAKVSTKQVVNGALDALQGMPSNVARLAATSMVLMSQKLEDGGRAPKGTTARLVAAITKSIGAIPVSAANAAGATNASLDSIASAMSNLAGAAGGLASSYESMVARLNAANSNMPTIGGWSAGSGGGGGGGGGGRGGRGGRGGQQSNELGENGRRGLPSNPFFGLAHVAVGSPTDLARQGALGDRQLRQARVTAQAAAAKLPGATESSISEAGDRAAITARKATITRLRTRIDARRRALLAQLKTCDISARMKIKVPQKGDARQKALDQRAKLREKENGIRDELETLAANYRDLAVESAELGDQVAALDRSDEAAKADAAQAAAAAAPTQLDFLNAAAAQAALSPGTKDDIAAADALVSYWQGQYADAVASGDPRRILDAAQGLKAAQDNDDALKANTAAVQANTDQLKQSFGGSVTFDYRGQSQVLRWGAPPSSDRLVGAEVGL